MYSPATAEQERSGYSANRPAALVSGSGAAGRFGPGGGQAKVVGLSPDAGGGERPAREPLGQLDRDGGIGRK